ncbi:MAG: hypothetical protein L6R38_008916 [Xanthoria sp. 2 TBL-2021]|nr:MAG: hypothetical protein L6R38_008916 [Xanthoria sp. 2 TBL-2021]
MAVPRRLEPQWDGGLIAASIAVSLLGAFTSTQLMCQARMSLGISSIAVWTALGSLTFGFCSIWCLHFVAMLACQLDLPIGINVLLTMLSALLAVLFTFIALASDLLWERFRQSSRRRRYARRTRAVYKDTPPEEDASEPLITSGLEDEGLVSTEASSTLHPTESSDQDDAPRRSDIPQQSNGRPTLGKQNSSATNGFTNRSRRISSVGSLHSGRSSSFTSTSQSSTSLRDILNIAYQTTAPAKNAFVATGERLYSGCTSRNIVKGFLWSLAITSMHYVGIVALKIPQGHVTLNPFLVILSAIISWVVCLVGCILISKIEVHLTQQLLFAVVASTGVAAMHFTGMSAVTFWSFAPPSTKRGYPPALAVAIVSIAITTCIVANFLLAHVATVSRNKLAEIVWTRKELWRTIAQKENAEAAAAARSDFIASASHEIRTPLHHLQGYSDLLSRTELTEEGRILLRAIQHATKTLSLITNNVLDWSKLERDSEAVCRPIYLDMRTVCESILMLLPNRDNETDVDLLVVVAPDVPQSLFLDETYIQRILMNLLSNALKFTSSGYILLTVEVDGGNLVATVKDTGCGIPQSFLPDLFEPFKQAQTRGTQRGTGLGLSIIRQLLHKMQGSIEVDSKYVGDPGVQPEQSGSTFTITVPVSLDSSRQGSLPGPFPPNVAIFSNEPKSRTLEGLSMAWKKFGYEPVVVRGICDLQSIVWKYIWVDFWHLQKDTTLLNQLVEREGCVVLIPYDDPEMLRRNSTMTSTTHLVPIPKPLLWDSFEQRINAVQESINKPDLSKGVRFAANVDVLDHKNEKTIQEAPYVKRGVVLLVEDNPINQKLGRKMLSALHYDVISAEDGVEGIEKLFEHDAEIDIILMDQSMPRKDGVATTQEIRELEASSQLSRRRPIIAVTAAVNARAQVHFKEAGADDFLAKPLSMAQLEETLAKYTSGARD